MRRLAISNLAWDSDEEDEIARLLQRLGVSGVEIAPTKIWKNSEEAHRSAAEYRAFWEGHGISVVAMQSLLFGMPELVLFGSESARDRLLQHLAGLCRVGEQLGARVLVFGSPQNRRRGSLAQQEAEAIAIPFFRRAGAIAADSGVALCVEANPEGYGCDFVTTTAEALSLVAAVGHPGFGLHLDTAGIVMSGEPIRQTLREAAPLAEHYHVSEPFLVETGSAGVDHAAFADALDEAGYSGWVSIEMRAGGSDNIAQAERALRSTMRSYRLGPESSAFARS